MPITKVEAPDGSILKIEHPEGASQADILRNAEVLFERRQIDLEFRDRERQRLKQANRAELDPNSPEFQERFGPTRGFLGNLAAGLGQGAVSLGRGLNQLGTEINVLASPSGSLVDLASRRQRDLLREQETERRAIDAPLLGTAGGLTGSIGTQVGAALVPGAVAPRLGSAAGAARAFSNPQTLRAATLSGAIQGAVQPVAEDELRSVNVGLGALGGAAGRAITRPFQQQASASQQQAIDLLEASGVPLDVAERTQSQAAITLARMLDDSLITSGSRQNFKDAQARAFTRAVMQTIGENSDEATEAAMNNARTRLGAVFNTIADGSDGINADRQFLDQAAGIFAEAQESLLDDEMRLFERNFTNILNSVRNGRINADAFNSGIRKLSNITPRPAISPYANRLQEAMFDALERTAPGSQEALRAARAQWRNLRIIQGVVQKGSDRTISPLRLSNALSTKRNQNLSIFGIGRDENIGLSNLARAGREILGSFADSGTPRGQQLPTIGLGAAGAGIAGVPGLLAALVGARGVSGAFNNQGLLGRLLAQGAPDAVAAPTIQTLINLSDQQQRELLEPQGIIGGR